MRLAAPNVLVMFVQASVGLIETYFVGWLGTDALAGVTLVFPALMLMQMMSAGAMGGGIASAVARALGAGRRADADALRAGAVAALITVQTNLSIAITTGFVGHFSRSTSTSIPDLPPGTGSGPSRRSCSSRTVRWSTGSSARRPRRRFRLS